MRSADGFRRSHLKLVQGVVGNDTEMSRDELAHLGLVELALHFLASRMPGTKADAGPYLLLGYHGVVSSFAPPGGVLGPLANLRHLASRLASIAAWSDAVRIHSEAPSSIRCYDIPDGIPVRRRTSNPKLLESLEEALFCPVPWSEQALRIAETGDYRVRSNDNQSVLAYKVPPLRLSAPARHSFSERPDHPAIILSKADLIRAAEEVDGREAAAGWPKGIKPLNLALRLRDIKIEGMLPGFWDDATERLTLEGVTHLVGMLSSGKSTLVWGLLFALTRDKRRPHRVALMATDTVQAAAYAARLKRHGVRATVLSSARRRARHLEGIHWQQKMAPGGASLASIGDLVEGFATACPLDGLQGEARVLQGIARGGNQDFPSLDEKPCHSLTPVRIPGDGDEARGRHSRDEGDEEKQKRQSCPLWSCCPLQSQQRDAVEADVMVFTPEAFAHMAPDRWVSDRRLTVPELLQFTADVVIIDEVDSIQKRLDGVFAPLSPIMGDERDVFAPLVGRQTAEALRKRSGAQFRSLVNTRWQSNFFNFFRLVGVMYFLLQAEEKELGSFFGDGPFTAGSLLYDLRRLRSKRIGSGEVPPGDFLRVVSVAAGIARSVMSEIAGDEEGSPGRGASAKDDDPAFAAAAGALGMAAASALRSDNYLPPLKVVAGTLRGALEPFEAIGACLGGGRRLSERGNALVLLLAVVTDLVLWHYHWLVRSQSAVARDLGMEDGALFGAAANLGRSYRTVLPGNPAGSLFGLQYDPPPESDRNSRGGRLTLINHLGVGRHLICHLHDLLLHEGQAGPHVLLLSGTSWAGGGMVRRFKRTHDDELGVTAEVASPIYDVQVPVKGVLRQPDDEVSAVARSVFRLVPMLANDRDGKARVLRASGLPQAKRRDSLRNMASPLATKRDRTNRFEETWDEMERRWTDGSMTDRRRAMLVVNSYADAVTVSAALSSYLAPDRNAPWHVRCLMPDRDDPDKDFSDGLRQEERLPRALVERFGETPGRSILVAPMSVVARGHNILNAGGKAAISAIWFLHRPHPRPDDLSAAVGRLNRYAMRRFGETVDPARYDGLADCARRMRHKATGIVREAMDNRGGFATLPAHLKASFAWDMLTPLWQTIGRGIRGGVPVFVGFVDRQFAPASMDGSGGDTTDSSVMVQAIHELEMAVDPMSNPGGHAIATRLYGAFLEALRRTEGLN